MFPVNMQEAQKSIQRGSGTGIPNYSCPNREHVAEYSIKSALALSPVPTADTVNQHTFLLSLASAHKSYQPTTLGTCCRRIQDGCCFPEVRRWKGTAIGSGRDREESAMLSETASPRKSTRRGQVGRGKGKQRRPANTTTTKSRMLALVLGT